MPKDDTPPDELAQRRHLAAVRQEAQERAVDASMRSHPAGRRAQALRCPECPHTAAAHTLKAKGCAYCTCSLLPPETAPLPPGSSAIPGPPVDGSEDG